MIAVSMISYLMLGVEELGIQIEEPFSILPIELICETISTSVVELQTSFPKPCTEEPIYDWEREAIEASS